jgi:hypothetical protein
MKKQLAIAAGVLMTLGTAVSASLNDYADSTKSATSLESNALEMDSNQSAQIVAMWSSYASSSGIDPMARPL